MTNTEVTEHNLEELLYHFEFSYIYTFLPVADWVRHSTVCHLFRQKLYTNDMFEELLKRDYGISKTNNLTPMEQFKYQYLNSPVEFHSIFEDKLLLYRGTKKFKLHQQISEEHKVYTSYSSVSALSFSILTCYQEL
jgi:hypothetical protein